MPKRVGLVQTFLNWMKTWPRSFFSLKKVCTIPTLLRHESISKLQIWYDDHRPKTKTFIGLPLGNFEMLSRLNESDLCRLFLNWMKTWPRPLFSFKKTLQVQLVLVWEHFKVWQIYQYSEWQQTGEVVVIFRNLAKFVIFFLNFHDFSTDSACPTHSHQLLFPWPGDNLSPWCFRHYMITTEHWYCLSWN